MRRSSRGRRTHMLLLIISLVVVISMALGLVAQLAPPRRVTPTPTPTLLPSPIPVS